MPEGDTIFRTARTLHRALAGQTVTRFETVLPKLARVDYDTPLAGRTVGIGRSPRQVGAHAFFRRPDPAHPHADERQLAHLPSRRKMAAASLSHAHRGRNARRCSPSPSMFPWPSSTPPPACRAAKASTASAPRRSSPGFDAALAIANLAARPDLELGLALLDQTALAGLGNVFKSEVAFACGLNPFRKVATLSRGPTRRSRRHRAQISPRQRDRNLRPSPHHRPHRSRGIPLGLRPRRPALPPVRHPHPNPASTPPMAASASGAPSVNHNCGKIGNYAAMVGIPISAGARCPRAEKLRSPGRQVGAQSSRGTRAGRRKAQVRSRICARQRQHLGFRARPGAHLRRSPRPAPQTARRDQRHHHPPRLHRRASSATCTGQRSRLQRRQELPLDGRAAWPWSAG